MDALLSVSMSLLGQASGSVPQTPPQPTRRPLANLTNVCATPDSSGEARRPGERRVSESHVSNTPPTPMTNLKLLTNIAASQPPGASSRKSLFAGAAAAADPPPPEGRENALAAGGGGRQPATPVLEGCRIRQPPMTPQSEEHGRAAAAPGDGLKTPVQKYQSVPDTPLSRPEDAAKLTKALATPKLRWKKHASDVLPLSSAGGPLPAPPAPAPASASKPRKEKSLSVLCARFLELYPLNVAGKEMFLPLDETALLLGTERRRIYDIVNVLESLHFSIKLEKNRYAWIGSRDLAETLGRLKGLALHLDLPTHLRAALHASDGLASPALRRNASEPALSTAAASPGLTPSTPSTPLADAESLTPRDRGDRTLGVLTQKFVMLLLVSDRPWLSQDVLARVLLGQDGLSPDGQHKAKVRRLYDIANILQSVGLVGKEASGVCRRPMFSYTGQLVDPIPVDPDAQRSRHSLIPSTPLSGRPATRPTSRSANCTPRASSSSTPTPDGTPRALSRPPSLDDICQVTALERHRLFEQSIDGSRGKNVLKRRLAEVQRAQAEVKRARPAPPPPPPPPAPAARLSPAQHSQLRELGIKRILIRSGDGSSQEICVREAGRRPAGDGDGPAGASRLEAALRGAWLAPGPAATPRQPRLLAPRQPQHQLVAYQLVPVVRAVSTPTSDAGEQTPVPILYDERTCLSLQEGVTLETAALAPAALPTATPETLLTPGTMTFIREAVSSGTIKTVCNMALTPDLVTPSEPEPAGRPRARPASRASRRLQMD